MQHREDEQSHSRHPVEAHHSVNADLAGQPLEPTRAEELHKDKSGCDYCQARSEFGPGIHRLDTAQRGGQQRQESEPDEQHRSLRAGKLKSARRSVLMMQQRHFPALVVARCLGRQLRLHRPERIARAQSVEIIIRAFLQCVGITT
jgi:hypothetical protein